MRFPSEDYEQEFGACRQYLPDEVVVDTAAMAALGQRPLPPAMVDLVRTRVLLDLPKRYY